MNAKLSPGCYLGTVTQSLAMGGLLLIERKYTLNARIPTHAHENAYFCLALQGQYTENYGNRTRSCPPMTLAYHPAEEVHSEHYQSTDGRAFNVELNAAWMRRVEAWAPQLRDPADVPMGLPVVLAARLYREFRLQDGVSPLAIEGLVLEILAELVRLAGPPRPPSWLARARDLLDDRVQENLGLDQIAAEVGVHPVHLATMFRRRFRQTPGEYQRHLRVAFACRQLVTTDAPLTEIALAAGFVDQSHFKRIFKAHVGMTPRAYRRDSRRP